MYNQAFGLGSSEFGADFDAWVPSVDEFEWELQEAPIEKPYEFCSNIKNSGGKESEIMDFKTGINHFIQVPRPLLSFSKAVSSWLWTPGPPWDITFLPKLSVK